MADHGCMMVEMHWKHADMYVACSAGSWYHDLFICFGLVFSVCQAPSYLCLEQMVAVGMTTWSSVLVCFGFLRVPGTFTSVPGANGCSWNDHLIFCFGLVWFSPCARHLHICAWSKWWQLQEWPPDHLFWFDFLLMPGNFLSVPGANGGQQLEWPPDHLLRFSPCGRQSTFISVC